MTVIHLFPTGRVSLLHRDRTAGAETSSRSASALSFRASGARPVALVAPLAARGSEESAAFQFYSPWTVPNVEYWS